MSVATQFNSASGTPAPTASASLYVGDLNGDVNETTLFEALYVWGMGFTVTGWVNGVMRPIFLGFLRVGAWGQPLRHVPPGSSAMNSV